MCLLDTNTKLGREKIQKQKKCVCVLGTNIKPSEEEIQIQKKCVCSVQIGNHQEKKGRKLRSAPR